jgi:hypothetical protein
VNTAIVVLNDIDGWADAAADLSESTLRGTLLKFSDWCWFKGKDSTKVPEGTKLIVLQTAHAWVKWKDKRPVEYRIRTPNTKLPDRAELGDLDETQWELSPDGKSRKDPWQNTRFVYLIDPITNEAFTFTTSSWGGRNAVIDLADQIVRTRRVRAGVVPLVELCAASHITKFGRKSKPHFKVIEWRGGTPEDDPQPQIECVTPEGVINDQLPW